MWRSKRRTRFVATSAPSDSSWFNSFKTGFKAWVGERRKQDAALPVALMLLKQRLLEEEWREAAAASDLAAQRMAA